ncbi:damage-inducible protein DinB [Photobacterium sanctipauli]|uniref:Damage-inducible protein DinB n=1 Tax=Photobacterium sanctipauli TaxID=1342794 RepID=A0A2T3NAI7_9GAMM|nr:DinB family protein [Photobacterium sanctipauli]PSW10764.1 damage-inducible protein DinB [Photobacterium sanctipauli]
MDLPSNFRMMALYNQRMNNQLMDVCESLTDEQLHAETHSFFSSVMSYWNHILFGDLIMLRRLIDNNIAQIEPVLLSQLPVATAVNETFVSNLKELKSLRQLVDSIYVEFTKSLHPNTCRQVVRYTTTEGGVLERNVAEFCQHIFNHQTHHRGQLTCVLSQFGLDFGCTDLPVIVHEGARS